MTIEDLEELTEEKLMQSSKRVLVATLRAQAAQIILVWREKATVEERVARLLAACDEAERVQAELSRRRGYRNNWGLTFGEIRSTLKDG